ncbi:MAG TPA: hypothetical protein VJN18_13250 [Polyangiaceae bacterium]|nr:hypothetical protein [Polyangiaceae bacterium]
MGALLASFAWTLTSGCSSGGADRDDDNSPGGNVMEAAAGDGATVVMPGTAGTGGSSGTHLNPLCGVMGQCLSPDNTLACLGYEPPRDPPSAAGGAGGEGGEGGEAGASGAEAGGAGAGGLGQGGSPNEPSGGDGGQTQGGAAQAGQGSGGAPSGSAGEGGSGGDSSVEPPASFGCQVVRVGNQLERQCQVAGDGAINAPCFSAADCQAGLACVSEGEAGRCLRYCCAGDGTCDKGTYCADQPLRKLSSDTSSSEPPRVPVCVPADDCSLEDTFPCPENTECRCKGNTACVVVRADGTTTCRVPGTGVQGDSCGGVAGTAPCAWNHVCSSVTQKCVKICHIDPAKDECAPQKCQTSSELPQNFGVCVGPLK